MPINQIINHQFTDICVKDFPISQFRSLVPFLDCFTSGIDAMLNQ